MATIYNRSSLRFVYPFWFDAETFDPRRKVLEQAKWQGRQQALEVWEPMGSTDQMLYRDFLLPHVARYLNPPDDRPSIQFWELKYNTLQSFRGLCAKADWTLVFPLDKIPFRLQAVQLILSRFGVGMLIISAQPAAETFEAWLNFLHYFRFVQGQRGVHTSLQRRVGLDPQTGQPQKGPVFPEPAGGLGKNPKREGVFGKVIHALLRTGQGDAESDRYTRRNQEQISTTSKQVSNWWKEAFIPGQMLPFAILFVDGVPKQEVASLLHKVRHFFHTRQVLHPAPESLRFDTPELLVYAQQQWFFFSLSGGGFLAFNAPDTPFFRETLPVHIQNQNFLLFLLALHQRFVMMKLSNDVADHGLDRHGSTDQVREAAFRRIRSALLAFTARGYFVQVVQREHHHHYYHKCLESFQVERLYRDVNAGVSEIHNYLSMLRAEELKQLEENREQAAQERAHRLERLIALLGVIIGAFGITIGFLGINMKGFTQPGLTLGQAFIYGIGGGAFLGVAFTLILIAGMRFVRRTIRSH